LAINAAAFVLTNPVDTRPEVPAPVAVEPAPVRVCAAFVVVAPCPAGAPDVQVGVDVPDVPTWVGCAPKLLLPAPTAAPHVLWLAFWPSAAELVRPLATVAELFG
jgi:hypothetical protein